ncbi:MAG TPA: methylated-DNA--[protein]-cysteine S-methyltransferase [Chloroflexota bacterium]
MRQLAQDLRALGQVRAPASLLPAVLAEVGIADAYARLTTPIGPCYVAFNRYGVSAVMRADRDDEFERAFRARFGRTARPAAEPPAMVHKLLAWQFGAGEDEAEETGRPGQLRFDLRGLSEFEQAVLLKALEIPRGEVRPYSWIARQIGNPKAVRAVGTALGNNPIPLLIPCHRVVRSDGQIGNYGYGPAAKRAALTAEGIEPEELESLARSGVRYFGSDTTRIFCFPTCRHARRVIEKHRKTFHSEAEALAIGYRPCKVCRPA